MPRYAGSLQVAATRPRSPAEIFTLFAELCDGVAHFHSKDIVHRDLKPANVFIDDAGRPIVGDFGLCFRFEAESLAETMEVASARWFGAPELRNGHLERPETSADAYSLGKLLYWLFTGRVYDREEQDYGGNRRLAEVLTQWRGIDPVLGVIDDRLIHAGAFADDIVSETVMYEPGRRIQDVRQVASKVRRAMARFQAGGRALDLGLPQRCLFCANGHYKALEVLPPAEQRLAPVSPGMLPSQMPDPYKKMRDEAENKFGTRGPGGVGSVGPLILICQHCGNVQQFRLDLAPDPIKNWRP